MTDLPPARRVVATVPPEAEGAAACFILTFGSEQTRLEPGRSWPQVDHFKWVTRGVVEQPQSFAVHPDGSVDFNGDTFCPCLPADAETLTAALNKRHLPELPPHPKPGTTAASSSTPAPAGSRKVRFRVHLDALGHLNIQATRGDERTATGMRGLAHLVSDGWLRPPRTLHVDPLQRYLEIDSHRFGNDPAGAEALERVLNDEYASQETAAGEAAIEVRESPGASTGFDIHFWTVRAGTRFEIKGHLGQDKLDILQDHDKCDLLQPGIILRISPPFLYFRRRRPDGGEEHVPGIPDLKYRSVSASELQGFLNHPAVRKGGSPTAAPAPPPTPAAPRAGVDPGSAGPSASLAPVGATETPIPAGPARPREALPAPPAPPAPPPRFPPAIPAPPVLGLPPTPLPTAFANADPWTINEGVFRQLVTRTHLPLQDVLFSLPHVFEDREFEILDFSGQEVESVLELRHARFHGFYLTHLGDRRIDLVYACHGTHLEWGTDRCILQPHAGAESLEFPAPALRGLAQDPRDHFVFLVEPAYREFARPHEKTCAEAFARFLTLEEWRERQAELSLIWPVTPQG